MNRTTSKSTVRAMLRTNVSAGSSASHQPGAVRGGSAARLTVAAVLGMQAAEMPPTALELQACAKEEAAYTALMAKWAALKTAK